MRAEQVALLRRVEVLDLAAQAEQRLADLRGLGQAAVLHRRDRLLEQPVRDRGRRPDVVVAELADVLDLVGEGLAVRVERGDRVEVARDHRVELGLVGGADRDRLLGLRRGHGRDRGGRLEDERARRGLGAGRRRGLGGRGPRRSFGRRRGRELERLVGHRLGSCSCGAASAARPAHGEGSAAGPGVSGTGVRRPCPVYSASRRVIIASSVS